MKKAIFSFLLAFLGWHVMTGQHFIFKGESPFGIQVIMPDSTRQSVRSMFADYDADGDLDIIHSGIDHNDNVDPLGWENIYYFLVVQENTGNRWYPHFTERKLLYDNFPFPLGYFFPAAADLNRDGRTDYLVFGNVDYAGRRTMFYCKKEPLGGDTEFEVTLLKDMELNDFLPESFFLPSLVDLDSDGDLDILMSGFDPPIGNLETDPHPVYYYAKNIGSSTVPEFLGWFSNPYGLVPDPFNEFITGAGDLDHDGDMDLIGSTASIPEDSINSIYVHINTPGTNGKPAFTTRLKSPFNLPFGLGEEQFLFPNLVDIDSDGDLDLFVNHIEDDVWHFEYYENTFCSLVTTSRSVSLCYGDMYVLGSDTFDIEGNYMVYVPGADGCDSLIELSLTVYDEIDPSVSVIGNLLMANANGVAYQWINCVTGLHIPGATGPSYTVQVTGNYAVLLTDTHGCWTQSDCIQVVISAIDDPAAGHGIRLYPNPTSGPVHIFSNLPHPIEKMIVYQISGEIVMNIIPQEGRVADFTLLTNGMYVVKIMWADGEVVRKLVVMKE